MSERLVVAIAGSVDGRAVRVATTFAGDTSPYVLVLSSALGELGVEAHSTYTGHMGAITRAVHLLLAPGRAPQTVVRDHEEHALPVWAARGRCLLDHCAVVQELAASAGHALALDVSDAALRVVDLPARAR